MKQIWRFWTKPSGVIYVQYRSNPGKWESTKTKDPAEAEQFAQDHCPENVAATGIKFADISKDFYVPGKSPWLTRQKARGIVYRTPHLIKMQGIVDNYLVPRFGAMDIRDIFRRQIDDWLLDLKCKRTRKPLQADIKNKILAAFRHVIREAIDRQYIERDPSDGIPPFRDLNRGRKEIFTVDELQKLFPHDQDELLNIWLTLDWAVYFFLQASAGLRPGEVGALHWGDWLRSKQGLVVSASIEASTRERKGTKTGAIKPIPLVSRAQNLLLQLESSREHTAPDQPLFTDTKGRPVILQTSQKHFEASLKRAGVDLGDKTPYSFRHSFDTHAMKLLDSATVQELMGHRTLKMTMDQYYHPTDEDRIEALPAGAWDGLERLWESND